MYVHKLRSVLALFCVMWGTLTVILLLALGDGFQTASEKNILDIADGAFFVAPMKTSKAYQGLPKGRNISVKAKDIVTIPEYVPYVKATTPMLSSETNIAFKNKQVQKKVYGVSEDFIKIRKTNLEKEGRFFNKDDTVNGMHYAVLGNKLKRNLYGDDSALGKNILIKGVPFKIIGVLQKGEKTADPHYDDTVIIPYSSYTSMWGNTDVPFFLLLANANLDQQLIENSLRSYFAYKYHFDVTDSKTLRMMSSTKMLKFFTWFFIGVKIFLGICGTLTLGVGCLGIQNIMFLTVIERTKEIGIRKAIGAYDRDILLQILLESFIIVILGGLLGFFLADFITTILQYFPLPTWLGVPEISINIATSVIIILSVLGMLTGYFPAKRAAKLDPVEAMRL